jgi:hypothetical protein
LSFLRATKVGRKVGGAEGERKKKGVRAERAQNDRGEGGEVHDQEEE